MKPSVYVQPGGCVEISHDGDFIHICHWADVLDAVDAAIERAQPYINPKEDRK